MLLFLLPISAVARPRLLGPLSLLHRGATRQVLLMLLWQQGRHRSGMQPYCGIHLIKVRLPHVHTVR
jgi:hypothetical protein